MPYVQPVVWAVALEPAGGIRAELEGGLHVHVRSGPVAVRIVAAIRAHGPVYVYPPQASLCSCAAGSPRSRPECG